MLVITGSSKLSGCYQSACIAREACHDPARVTVLDSLNATCAEYMLVDQALRYRREGVSDMPTMLAKLRDVMAHYKIIGMAADLKYLVMGGRLSPLVGKLGNRLSIKPTLKIEDGIVSKAGMVHGMAKGRAWYIEQLKECPPDRTFRSISAARTARRRLRSSSRRLKRRISAFRTSAASKSGV